MFYDVKENNKEQSLAQNTYIEYLEKQESSHFEKLYAQMGECWRGNKTKIGQKRRIRRLNFALKYLQPTESETILEIGCGTGVFSYYLAETGAKIIGLDIVKSAIDIAQKNNKYNNVEFITGSIYNLHFEDNSIDIITGNGILHHLLLDKAIPEIKRVLKPNGKMIFFEPNKRNPQKYLETKIKILGQLFQNTENESPFYKNEIENILIKQGFSMVNVETFDFAYPFLPDFCAEFVEKFGLFIEKIPFIKEYAGCLKISAVK
jgi:ubiquinone/menaquinone biosynthesis C-methylase UbiE